MSISRGPANKDLNPSVADSAKSGSLQLESATSTRRAADRRQPDRHRTGRDCSPLRRHRLRRVRHEAASDPKSGVEASQSAQPSGMGTDERRCCESNQAHSMSRQVGSRRAPKLAAADACNRSRSENEGPAVSLREREANVFACGWRRSTAAARLKRVGLDWACDGRVLGVRSPTSAPWMRATKNQGTI